MKSGNAHGFTTGQKKTVENQDWAAGPWAAGQWAAGPSWAVGLLLATPQTCRFRLSTEVVAQANPNPNPNPNP